MENELLEKLETILLQSIGEKVYVDEELQSLDEEISTYTRYMVEKNLLKKI